MFYWGSSSLSDNAGANDAEKKQFFIAHYWDSLTTFYPYIGLLCCVIIVALGNYFLNAQPGLAKSIVIGITCGWTYHQWHCKGIDEVAKR